MSNVEKYPKCHMRTSLGNCDPIGGFCTSVNKDICEALHKVAEPKTDEENELKFYYVESIDDYWIGGVRIDNFYYATWWSGMGFMWSHSRYLPWGEHIVDENTLWKEHTYPSEPIEIPFTEWIVGFTKKYFAQPKTGHWIVQDTSYWRATEATDVPVNRVNLKCSCCGYRLHYTKISRKYCPECGADMRVDNSSL